jgi:hypothetical protein
MLWKSSRVQNTHLKLLSRAPLVEFMPATAKLTEDWELARESA